MAQRNANRIDRFAQMSQQEQLIAKKRQEILEKQRTTQLAKAVAAAQNLSAKLKSEATDEAAEVEKKKEEERKKEENLEKEKKDEKQVEEENANEEDKYQEKKVEEKKETEAPVAKEKENEDESVPVTPEPAVKPSTSLTGKIKFSIGGNKRSMPVPVTEQPPPKIQNFFCNDGSFLDHFKKILEKHEAPKPPVVVETAATQAAAAAASAAADNLVTPVETSLTVDQAAGQPNAQHSLPPPPPQPQFAFETSLLLQDGAVARPPQLPLLPQQQQSQQQQPQIAAPHVLPMVSYASAPPASVPQPAAAYYTPIPRPHIPPPPPPSAVPMIGLPNVASAPPPPPPPPQLPIALANVAQLYMIPAPEPMQLNAIPAPKEFDLNAIPKPQLNLEAIQVPAEQEQNSIQQMQRQHIQQQQQMQHQQQMQQQQQQIHQHQQMQHMHQHQMQQQQMQQQQIQQQQMQQQQMQQQQIQHQQMQQQQQIKQQQIQQQQQQQMQQQQQQMQQQMQLQQPQQEQHPTQQQVFSDNNDQCLQIPTTIERLIALVADFGDDYEDKLCARKNDLHPNMWFLFDKSSEQYHNYRHQLNERRRSKQQQHNQHQQNKTIEFSNEEPGTSSQNRAHVAAASFDGEKYDPESIISGDVDSDDEYMRGMMDRNRDNIKRRIECRNELSEEERQEEERQRQEKKKLRKSRWGEKVEVAEESLSSPSSGVPTAFANQHKPILSTVTRSDPQLLQYARLNYGSTSLTEEDWKKCEEHYKVNLLYQDMMRKRQEIDRLARNGKFKYEYDSDEDVDGGTWEHKLRCAEMDATQAWAQALTKQSEGKHHIGDFLPPEELKKFMEQYESKKNNRQPDLSDYKEYKLKEDNIGFQMLQKLGWKEGQGLGSGGAGIIDPVNKAPQRDGNQGLGVASAAEPENCDNEYDAYRKRMMLAYRFRPNPLNNPRRAYY